MQPISSGMFLVVFSKSQVKNLPWHVLLYIHSAYIESTLRISVTKSKMPKFMEKLLFLELILKELLFGVYAILFD